MHDGSTATRRDRRLIVLFVLVLAALPAELLIARAWSEPYPALFQPAFTGSPERDGRVEVVTAAVTAELATGQTRAVAVEDIVPDSDLSSGTLLNAGYGSPERAQDRQTKAWLSQRMSDLFGAGMVERVVITWTTDTLDIHTRERLSTEVSRQVVIDVEESS